MIRSMTGYGRGRAERDGEAMTAEIRSVNARQREIRVRLPQELYPLEREMREQVAAQVNRGRVDVTLGWDRQRALATRLTLSREGVEAALVAWTTLRDEYGLPDEPRAEALLRIPGVLEAAAEGEEDLESLGELARAALSDALAAHSEARAEEGAKLLEDLRDRARLISESVEAVREPIRGAPERLAQQIRDRVEEILQSPPVDDARLAQEIATLAQRADVTEELVRLDAHLERLASVFDDGAEEIGRQLEFLVQEIRREVTTLASKASSPDVDERVLEIKGELERIREQAANVE